ncbi:MAG: 50S ribosomal protein L25 [Bacillota bacterium]|nr:50S ribosomal protein L25 [Bacillota bacterium]
MAQTLQCEQRDVRNTGYLKDLKRKGWVPGVIYGKETETISILLSGKELEKNLNRHGYHGLFTLQMKGQSKPYSVLIRSYQKHPISGKLIHLDFLMVQANEKITSEIGIQWLGEEEIEKTGNLVQIIGRNVDISCLPTDIPDTLQMNISSLGVGDKVVAGDLTLPEGVELVTDAETTLLNIASSTKASAEEMDANLDEDSVKDAVE